jgi:predicted aspartyl protease
MKRPTTLILLLASVVILLTVNGCLPIVMMKKFKSGKPVLHAESSSIKMILDGHKMLVKVVVNDNSEEFVFLLDTGAMTMISSRVAEKLKIEKGRKLPGGDAVHLAKPLISIRMGDAEVRDFKVPIIDLGDVFDSEQEFDGFIGSDFLRFFRVTMNYQEEFVTIESSSENSVNIPGTFEMDIKKAFPFKFPLAAMMMEDSMEVEGMIDTGSPFSIVCPLSMLEKQDLSVRKSYKAKGSIVKWPFTKSLDNYLIRAESLEMGDLEVKNIPVIYADLPNKTSSSLIGEGFLSNFVITIDYPEDKMFLTPIENMEFEHNIFSIGVELKQEENIVSVKGLWEGSPADLAGLKVGDKVLKVNSVDADNSSISDIREILTDRSIKNVELLIENEDGVRSLNIKKEFLFSEI